VKSPVRGIFTGYTYRETAGTPLRKGFGHAGSTARERLVDGLTALYNLGVYIIRKSDHFPAGAGAG
jgi:hypothetical protein